MTPAILSYAQSLRAIDESIELLATTSGMISASNERRKNGLVVGQQLTASEVSQLHTQKQHDKDHVMPEAHKLSQVLRLVDDHLAQSQRLKSSSSGHHVQPALWIPGITL